jgi:hypothetical protein
MTEGGEEFINFLKENENSAKIFFVLFIIIFLFCFFNSFFGVFEKNVCGDGSSYGECSKNQPYYCSKGILVQNASFCGCPENSSKKGDFCEYPYQTSPKFVMLYYILDGEYKRINFSVYEGMVDYLKKHPQRSFYFNEENYSLEDFKLRIINEPEQKKLLMPLVIEIQNIAKSKEDQARVAISLVQHISYEEQNNSMAQMEIYFSSLKYPYDVLYQEEGLCGSKSDLLAFLLREIGYDLVMFHYFQENHEAIGIKCPKKYSLNNTGYCFIESTQPAIIGYSQGEYSGGRALYSSPKIIKISEGISLDGNMEEYRDARMLNRIYNVSKSYKQINLMEYFKLSQLTKKYGLVLDF